MKTLHRIRPRDKLEVLQIRALEVASEILCEYLKVDVILQAQRQAGWCGSDTFHSGMYSSGDRLIKINFRNLEGSSTKSVLTILGHEFRHAFQFQHGLYVNRKWLGEKFQPSFFHHNKRYAAYLNEPIEIDARAYQEIYANIVLNDIRFSNFKNALNIPGNIPLRKDIEATYRLIGFEPYDPRIQFFIIGNKTYWLSSEQVHIKKWSKRYIQKAFAEHKELMLEQPVNYVMVPIDITDLVS